MHTDVCVSRRPLLCHCVVSQATSTASGVLELLAEGMAVHCAAAVMATSLFAEGEVKEDASSSSASHFPSTSRDSIGSLASKKITLGSPSSVTSSSTTATVNGSEDNSDISTLAGGYALADEGHRMMKLLVSQLARSEGKEQSRLASAARLAAVKKAFSSTVVEHLSRNAVAVLDKEMASFSAADDGANSDDDESIVRQSARFLSDTLHRIKIALAQ